MLIQIVSHTPAWVFILFAVLLAVGLRQRLPRRVALPPLLWVAAGMGGWSLWSAAAPLAGRATLQALALVAWATGATATAAWVQRRKLPAGTAWDAATRRFALPGSTVPLVLMMGIFFTRYAASVSLVLQPALAQSAGFALTTGLLYGGFSGVFAGRALRWARLAWPDTRVASPA